MKYLMKLRYIGTNFYGYQYQPYMRTVQGVLNDAFKELFGETVQVTSCSRTDRGVHANASRLTVELPTHTCPIPCEKLPIAVSHHLPDDVSVFDAEEVEESFHVRHDVVAKEYVYRIYNEQVKDPFEVNRSWHYPIPITEKGIELMNAASKFFLGTHDFAAFQAQGSPVATTVRTITSLNVEKKENLIFVRVRADGFLYNMVRIIVGTLIDVAKEHIHLEDMKEIIDSRDRTRAGQTAPPEGLYLNEVFYS